MRESSQRHYLARQEEIISAAYRIVCDKGLPALSMRAISNSINLSPASLYEYFTSKDDILFAIFNKTIGALETHLCQVDTSLPPDKYLIALCLRYLDFADKEQKQVAVMRDTAQAINSMRVAASRSGAGDRLLISSTNGLFDLFLLGVKQYLHWKRITPSIHLSVEDIAHTLLAIAYGSMLTVAHTPKAASPAILSTTVQSLLNGLEVATVGSMGVIGRDISTGNE